MKYTSFDQFLTEGAGVLAKGPIAVVMAEDDVEVDSTLRHHLGVGFAHVILLAHDGIMVDPAIEAQVQRVDYDTHADNAPMICATINIGTSINRIPANVSENARAKVTAGFAKEVEAVNQ